MYEYVKTFPLLMRIDWDTLLFCFLKVSRCPSGQYLSKCKSTCQPTCENPEPICTSRCITGCRCRKRNPILHKGKCVRRSECKGGYRRSKILIPHSMIYVWFSGKCIR